MIRWDAGNVYIMVPPRNTTAEEGSRVRFECQAGGYPDNVTVHWSLNGVDVDDVVQLTQPLRRVDVLPDGALVIDDVTKDDSGWYKCRPSNRLGTAPEAEAFLNVTCESLNNSRSYFSVTIGHYNVGLPYISYPNLFVHRSVSYPRRL